MQHTQTAGTACPTKAKVKAMSHEPSPPVDSWLPLSRRQLLQAGSLGLGWLAVQFLGQTEPARAEATATIPINLRPKRPQFPAKAKSVILLMQNGGPSHMDLFEPKPALDKYDGKSHSIKVEMFQQGSEKNTLLTLRRGGAGWSCRR
jgi:hypothetical protein